MGAALSYLLVTVLVAIVLQCLTRHSQRMYKRRLQQWQWYKYRTRATEDLPKSTRRSSKSRHYYRMMPVRIEPTSEISAVSSMMHRSMPIRVRAQSMSTSDATRASPVLPVSGSQALSKTHIAFYLTQPSSELPSTVSPSSRDPSSSSAPSRVHERWDLGRDSDLSE